MNKIYQVYCKYSSGDTFGRDENLHETIVFESENLDLCNEFANNIIKRDELSSHYKYIYKKDTKDIYKQLIELNLWFASTNYDSFKIEYYKNKFKEDPCLLLFAFDGYFECLELVEVREKPSENPTFFSLEK